MAYKAAKSNDAELVRRTYHYFVVTAAFHTAEALADIFASWYSSTAKRARTRADVRVRAHPV